MKNRKPVLIDCDTGIDDAIALTIAAAADNIEILAVTAVAGNTTVDNSTRNTCNVLHLLGRDDIPVAKGAAKPLVRELMTAGSVHGRSGLRGWNFESDYTDNLSSLSAVGLMTEKILEAEDKVTLIALGPVTNIEALLRLHPETKERIGEIVFMGTSYHSGNPTALSTFNVLVDPEAFREVLHSGVPVTACPLETTRKSFLTADDRRRIRDIGNIPSAFVTSVLSGYGELLETKNDDRTDDTAVIEDCGLPVPMHDPTTVAYVIRPELFTGTKYYADVECSGSLTLGFTLIDRENYYRKSEEEKNLFFLENIDREGFVSLFLESLRKYR